MLEVGSLPSLDFQLPNLFLSNPLKNYVFSSFIPIFHKDSPLLEYLIGLIYPYYNYDEKLILYNKSVSNKQPSLLVKGTLLGTVLIYNNKKRRLININLLFKLTRNLLDSR